MAGPEIRVDTAKLRNHAAELRNINRRLADIDRRMDKVYWHLISLDDLIGSGINLWRLFRADIVTQYERRISSCVSYLNITADAFERAERDINTAARTGHFPLERNGYASNMNRANARALLRALGIPEDAIDSIIDALINGDSDAINIGALLKALGGWNMAQANGAFDGVIDILKLLASSFWGGTAVANGDMDIRRLAETFAAMYSTGIIVSPSKLIGGAFDILRGAGFFGGTVSSNSNISINSLEEMLKALRGAALWGVQSNSAANVGMNDLISMMATLSSNDFPRNKITSAESLSDLLLVFGGVAISGYSAAGQFVSNHKETYINAGRNVLEGLLPTEIGASITAVELLFQDNIDGWDFANLGWGAANSVIKKSGTVGYFSGVFLDEARLCVDSYQKNKDTTDYSLRGIGSTLWYGVTHPLEFVDAAFDGLDEVIEAWMP